MPSADRIFALRGMHHAFGAEYAARRQIQDELEAHLRLHAYAPIGLPILENTELYLRKSGEDIAARLYEFNFKSRRIALRPEMTASILRAYVEGLQDEPLPLRIQYTGPVFRYEKPQQNRYRQFTMTGAEMLGASDLMADAEIVYLACAGLEKLGIRQYKLVIGHTAVLAGFLHRLGLRKQLLNFLLRNMENIRKRGMPFVVESLREIDPQLELTADLHRSDTADPIQSQQLVHVLRGMSDAEAHQAIADFLYSLNIRIDANRDEGEVIDRLLHKIREDQQGPKLRRALNYMQRLSELVGAPADVLPPARKLLDEYGQHPAALAALESLLKRLAWFGSLNAEIQLDFGLNRGLHYYTGLMFEIHCSSQSGEEIQLCGGGRYDNLVTVLGGGAPVPALGFAYGIERIASLLPADEPALRGHQPDVYIIPIEAADYPCSLEVARGLRGRDVVVEVSIDRRSVRRSLKHADRRRAPIVILIGEAERQRRQMALRDMRNHQEQRVSFDDIQSIVERLLADHAQRPAQE